MNHENSLGKNSFLVIYMSNSKNIYDVCVVGGGISGLTSAHEMAPYLKVAVIERNTELGGVARSWKTNENVFIEHSWRGFPIIYKNVRSILAQIPYKNTTCLHNLTHNDIFFNYKFLFEKNKNTNYYTINDIVVVLFYSFIHVLTRGTYDSSLTLKDVLSRNFYNLIGYTGLGLDPSISSITDLVKSLFLLQFNHFHPFQRIHVNEAGNIKTDLLVNFEFNNVYWSLPPQPGEYTILQKYNNRYYISPDIFFELKTNTISYQAFTKSTQEGWFSKWKNKLENDGVDFYINTAVVAIENLGGYYRITLQQNGTYFIYCKKLVVACGFQSIDKLFNFPTSSYGRFPENKRNTTSLHSSVFFKGADAGARAKNESTWTGAEAGSGAGAGEGSPIVKKELYNRLNISVSTTCIVKTRSKIKEPYSVFLDSPVSFSYQIINHIFENSNEVPPTNPLDPSVIFNIHCLVNKEGSILYPNKTVSQLTEKEFKEEMKYYLFLLCKTNGIEIDHIKYISVSEDVVFDGIEAHTKYDAGFFITKGDNLIKKQYEYLPDVYFAGHDVENTIDIRTMEAACETGKVAAKKCLEDLQIRHEIVIYTMTKVEDWFVTLNQSVVCIIIVSVAFIYILINIQKRSVGKFYMKIMIFISYIIFIYVIVCICQLFRFAKGLYDIYGTGS